MLEVVRRRLSYANVMATLAIFVALGGTSYAVTQIGSAQIKNNSVRGADLKNNDVDSADIENGSLLGQDFKAGQLPAGAAGATGPGGPAGTQGGQGPKGDAGPAGADGTARGYARVDIQGGPVLSQSKGIVGVTYGMDTGTYDDGNDANDELVPYGAYCFDLTFTPASVNANSIADPRGAGPGPGILTAGPDLNGVLIKDRNGHLIKCPPGYRDAAVLGVTTSNTLSIAPGGFFVLFN